MRNVANGLLRLNVDSLCLHRRYSAQRFDLPIVEAGGFAIARETNCMRIDSVKFRQRSYGIMPPDPSQAPILKLSNVPVSYISFLSCAETSGSEASSTMRPSKNSMI